MVILTINAARSLLRGNCCILNTKAMDLKWHTCFLNFLNHFVRFSVRTDCSKQEWPEATQVTSACISRHYRLYRERLKKLFSS